VSIHLTSAVRVLLEAGIPVDPRGELGATALRWAHWKGYPDLVKLLLRQFHTPSAGWFAHGLENCSGRDGDYPQVARVLLTTGAKIAANDLPTSNAAIEAIFREDGLIE